MATTSTKPTTGFSLDTFLNKGMDFLFNIGTQAITSQTQSQILEKQAQLQEIQLSYQTEIQKLINEGKSKEEAIAQVQAQIQQQEFMNKIITIGLITAGGIAVIFLGYAIFKKIGK